jgi:hypothetical protein
MSQKEDNKFVQLMDIIDSNNENKEHQKLQIPNYSINSSSNNAPETLDEEEDESKQSLNPEHHDLLDMNSSSIIQNPLAQNQSISSDDNSTQNDYATPLNSKELTLNESISLTILRDVHSIYYKLKFVINPFSSNNEKKRHITQWDLWGPLLFVTFLSCTLAIKAKEKSKIIVIIFVIFWLGSLLVYLNGNLLDSNIKLFQVMCLLGYCLFPLNISAFILAITNFYEIIRFIIVLLTCFWSLFSIEGYFRIVSSPHQKYLVFYPAILMFAFISWFIFVTE